MNKINITIELDKVDKTKIIDHRWFDKENREHITKELKLEVVPLKESKILKDEATYTMVKTHFVAMEQTKEERDAKVASKIIGTGITFMYKNTAQDIVVPKTSAAEPDNNDLPW